MDSNASRQFTYRLITLGPPRLEIIDDKGEVRVVGPGKPLALVTYLALSPRRSESREILCDLLWGDRNPEQARPHLRQTLWLIKTQIGDSIVSADGNSIRLSCSVETDVGEFLRSIEHDELVHAVAVYNGDFFSDYAAPGAGAFEEWANLERTRLRSRFVHAAEMTARRALDSGHFSEAVALAIRMRAVDPHGQAGWRLLLEGRVASGDLIGARADADQFEDWLRREEWEAEPASLAAIQLARKSPTTIEEGHSQDLMAELVGRESQFSAIHAAWLDVHSGATRLIHISADAGLGKTRLTKDVLARIRAGRGRARYIHANHGERGIPFSFASQIAESLSSLSGAERVSEASARILVALNPILSARYRGNEGAPEHLETLRVGLALHDLLGAVSEEKPVVVAIDDLHWADQESRDVLKIVISRIEKENVLLLTASRPQYGNVVARDDIIDLCLGRLTENDVEALVASLARLPDEQWANSLPSRLLRIGHGSPLRILQCLRYCLDAGILERSNEMWLCSKPSLLPQALDERDQNEQRLFFLNDLESHLLLAVSIAGIPLSRAMVAEVLECSALDLEKAADSLELQGLLVVEDGQLLPSHDSIAESHVAQSSAPEIKAVHRVLAEVMSRQNSDAWQARSIRHLVAADKWTDASSAITRILRAHADQERNLKSVVESLIQTDDPGAVSRIVAALPLRVRRPRLTRQLTVAGLMVIAAAGVTGYVKFRDNQMLRDQSIAFVERNSDDGTDVRLAALSDSHWDPSAPLKTRKIASLRGWLGAHLMHATPRPGTNQWAIYKIYPDSGEGDIDLLSPNGDSRRLMISPGDDRPMSFSPDGSKLLFLTTRWSTNGWPDVAIINVESGSVRRLSVDPKNHGAPHWSPDGTRVVYTRESESDRGRELCVVDSDGSHLSCRRVAGWSRVMTFGWLDDHRLLITGDTGKSVAAVAIYNWLDYTVSQSDYPSYAEVTLDPTGKWALTRLTKPAQSEVRVSPSLQFARSIVIPLPAEPSTEVRFLSPGLAADFLDSVSVAPAPHVQVGIPYQLRARGWTKNRREITPAVARWRSLSPTTATIDSLGVLVGRQAGMAVVELSAGGWRTTLDTLRIDASVDSRVVVDEKWDRLSFQRWKPFGDPKPAVIHDDRSALANNGDGNFFSGIYFREPLASRSGIAFDAELSTPITRYQWQMIQVMLHPFSNANRIEKWDHVTGYIQEYLDSTHGCAFQYPGGEGPESITRPSWYYSWRAAAGDSSHALHRGSWYRVRVQLFPDGRCGLAINGHAVVIGVARTSYSAPILAILQGSSAEGKILVGRSMIRIGVPTDIDWSQLQFDGYQWASVSTVR